MAIARLDSGSNWGVSFDGGSTWHGIYIPAPNIKIEHTNVASSDSGRTEDGVMHINWVRTDVRKVNLLYNSISGNEKYNLMYNIDGSGNGLQGREFKFRYLDGLATRSGRTVSKGVITIDAYCGESSYEYYSSVHRPEEGGIYTNFSINVIEM